MSLGKLTGASYSINTVSVSVCIPLWICVHMWVLQRVYEHGYEWENVSYVCSLPQLFTVVIIWRGQVLTRHTNTHHHHSGFCHGLRRPGPVILTSPRIWILLLPLSAPCTSPKIHSAVYWNYTGIYENISTAKMGFIRSAWRMWSLRPPFQMKYQNIQYSTCFFQICWLWRMTLKHILVSALFYWDRFWPCSTTDGRV